jgi:hypothetical protein
VGLTREGCGKFRCGSRENKQKILKIYELVCGVRAVHKLGVRFENRGDVALEARDVLLLPTAAG